MDSPVKIDLTFLFCGVTIIAVGVILILFGVIAICQAFEVIE